MLYFQKAGLICSSVFCANIFCCEMIQPVFSTKRQIFVKPSQNIVLQKNIYKTLCSSSFVLNRRLTEK